MGTSMVCVVISAGVGSVPESSGVFFAVISETSVLLDGSEEERLSSPESEIYDICPFSSTVVKVSFFTLEGFTMASARAYV